MPTKRLDSPLDRNGLQDTFKFGGGADVVFTTNGAFPFGYIINTGGGNDIVYGSNLNDVLSGGDGTDAIFGGFGNDIIWGGNADGSPDSSKGQNPAPTNTLVGDGEQQADGTYSADVTFIGGAVFDAGHDTINGGNGSSDNIFGDASIVSTQVGETFNGGNDVLRAGDGGSNGLVGDANIVDGTGTVNGGADTLISGTGNDQMVGDFANFAGFHGIMTTGADTFVFGADNGFDSIADFEVDKDTLNLAATGLTFASLDTFVDGVIDDLDDFSTVSGSGMTINLGGAITGNPAAFGDQIVMTNVFQLTALDFDFSTLIA